MNTTLQAIAAKLGSATQGDAVAYVGRNVLTAGDTAYPRTAGGIAGAVEIAKDADKLTVSISDANGAVLRTLDLGASKAAPSTSTGMAPPTPARTRATARSPSAPSPATPRTRWSPRPPLVWRPSPPSPSRMARRSSPCPASARFPHPPSAQSAESYKE